MLGKSGDKGKKKKINLALINEGEELDEIGGFNGAIFPTIDTLDEDEDDIGEEDLNWMECDFSRLKWKYETISMIFCDLK